MIKQNLPPSSLLLHLSFLLSLTSALRFFAFSYILIPDISFIFQFVEFHLLHVPSTGPLPLCSSLLGLSLTTSVSPWWISLPLVSPPFTCLINCHQINHPKAKLLPSLLLPRKSSVVLVTPWQEATELDWSFSSPCSSPPFIVDLSFLFCTQFFNLMPYPSLPNSPSTFLLPFLCFSGPFLITLFFTYFLLLF